MVKTVRALYITRAGDWSFTKVPVENLNDIDFIDKLLGIQNGTHLSRLFRMKANDGSLSTSTFCVWYTTGEEFVQQRPTEAIRQLSAWTGRALICRCAARGPGLVNARTGDETYARVAIERILNWREPRRLALRHLPQRPEVILRRSQRRQ